MNVEEDYKTVKYRMEPETFSGQSLLSVVPAVWCRLNPGDQYRRVPAYRRFIRNRFHIMLTAAISGFSPAASGMIDYRAPDMFTMGHPF